MSSANLGNLAEALREVASEADGLHLGVTDGRFITNLTIGSCVGEAARGMLDAASCPPRGRTGP